MGIMTQLATRLGVTQTWPPAGQREIWEEVELFQALRLSDETRIRMEASIGWWKPYVLSPVPRMVSRASANLLFGEAATFSAENENDQDNLDRIIIENGLHSEAHRAAVISSSEGEVWGRIVVAPDVLDVPIIEFVSRRNVIPHFAGRFVQGATFVTEWATGTSEVVRLLETYDAGSIESLLCRGTRTTLGQPIGLDSFDPTRGRQEMVLTGIDWPLVAFIPNTIDADVTRGYSDYAGLRDRFLALNEAATVGQANLRLAGRKRALVDGAYLNRNMRLDTDDDVLIRTDGNGVDGDPAKALQIIDYAFQAKETIAWVDHLLDTTLAMAGISPQSVGRNVDGGAISGTALKLKMSHSLMEAAGKQRHFAKGLKRLLRAAQIIDGRSIGEGGFARSYVARDSEPSITFGDGLPRDDMETADEIMKLVSADALSIEQRVERANPDFTEQQMTDEIDRLRAEQTQALPPVPSFQ